MNPVSLIFTIFGSTGDLTYRKLLPALYHLQHRGLLADDFEIRCIGRKAYRTQAYLEFAKPWIEKQSRFKFDEQVYQRFIQHVRYIQLEFTQVEAYQALMKYPEGLDNLYYFAVAPSYFETIGLGLQSSGLLKSNHHRVILEKPFGDSLEHAQTVNHRLSAIFGSECLYHIDHYLGKEMIQNILAIRFTNRLFEGVWDNHHIESIQITAAETVGVETRGSYYELAGAMKDMVQNHLIQILSYVVMEQPYALNAQDLLVEQLKVLKSLTLQDLILGQYTQNQTMLGYTQEDKVDPHSQVETYAALKATLSKGPLKDVPLFLRTGKRLNHKATYIKVIFKPAQSNLYVTEQKEVLTIKIQPDEGVSLEFNAKKPGTLNTITSVKMDFCQSCILENRINTPEAYEKLLDDAFNHDNSLFTPWEMVELGWKFGQAIEDAKRLGSYVLHPYPANSRGPLASDELLAKDQQGWLEENEFSYENKG